jgi:hypothetical protein
MRKHHFTLSIPETLIEEMKVQAVREKRSVSEITEELYTQYLKRVAKSAKESK